jgi:phthalate 4,5-dioxygenase
VQRTASFTGIPEFWAQDAAMQEGMGPIFDRSNEHLGTSDLGIITVRRRILQEARALAAGGNDPPGVWNPEIYQVRGAAALLPHEADWLAATADLRQVVPGVNPPGV